MAVLSEGWNWVGLQPVFKPVSYPSLSSQPPVYFKK
jgi:hypothetical protein